MWFRDYKTPDGKPVNKFGYDDQWQNKEFTLKVRAAQCGGKWEPLVLWLEETIVTSLGAGGFSDCRSMPGFLCILKCNSAGGP